jgi:hypothetical protein
MMLGPMRTTCSTQSFVPAPYLCMLVSHVPKSYVWRVTAGRKPIPNLHQLMLWVRCAVLQVRCDPQGVCGGAPLRAQP